MQDTNQKESIRPMESLLVLVTAGYCLLITFMLWMSVSAYQPIWPFPALYFVEMAALSIFCAYTFTQRHQVGKIIIWGAAGITGVFSLAGAMTVGFFYLPISLIFAFVAIKSDLRNKQPIATHLGICLMTGLVQVALMFWAIRLLN